MRINWIVFVRDVVMLAIGAVCIVKARGRRWLLGVGAVLIALVIADLAVYHQRSRITYGPGPRGNDSTAQRLRPPSLDRSRSEDSLIFNAVDSGIPELDLVADYLERASKDSVHLMMMIRGYPDEQTLVEPRSYEVYIGESHATHTVRLFTVIVDSATRKLTVWDIGADTSMPLARFRAQLRDQYTVR